jgi:hypothetical protein
LEYGKKLNDFCYLKYIFSSFQQFKGKNNPRNHHYKEKCFLTHLNEPLLYLSPVKLEIIMVKPVQINYYHSVLTTEEIKKINGYTTEVFNQIKIIS